MSWTNLPTDYKDAVWSGLKKYAQVTNEDGTVSFKDMTVYTNKENSFFGAAEANQMNAAMNELAGSIDSAAENAASSATAASTSEKNAASSATSAAGSASTATTKASEASTSATKAATSEKNAASSADKATALIYNNAGAHNAIYRGKNLGTAVTDAQYAAIAAGTFEDLYIGDYWTINNITWRIAAFDYYLSTGDTECTTHHVTIVPDTQLYIHVMNDTNTTEGGYISSKMYTEGLTQAKTAINTAFGSAHILTHRLYLCNAVTSGAPSGRSWYNSTVELMTEQNVYGCKILAPMGDGVKDPWGQMNNYEVDKSQYPLFAHDPHMISNRQWFWLRDVVTGTRFASVNNTGEANYSIPSSSGGVRPAFCIKK